MNSKFIGQSSKSYMLLKTHPSEKNKTVKFDEYKLLCNQIDRKTEVINRMNTRPQGRQTQQSKLINTISIEAKAEVTDSFPVMTE